jgi:hypothetical protein
VKYGKSIIGSVRTIDNVSIAGFVVLAQLFILLSAPHIWNDDNIMQMFMVYFLMLGVAFSVLGAKNPFYEITVFDGLSQFLLSFVVGIFIFSKLDFGGSSNFGGFESLTLLILSQVLVVGLVEELLFRGAIPQALDNGGVNPNSSRFIASLAFALFHGWAYSWAIMPMFSAFIFGILMQYIWDGGNSRAAGKGYPLVAAGIHAAWNVAILAGAFSVWVYGGI